MKLSYCTCVLTFSLWLAECSKIFKKHVYNSIEPLQDIDPIYNISVWVKQLHLQQCVIVEIGEKYCAVFVEQQIFTGQNASNVEEYFLGLCDSETLRKWRYCPIELEKERTKECIFQEFTQFSKHPARVHRRLCDVSGLSYYADPCDCTKTLGGKSLYAVTGFPTCFISPLPDSICIPRNVCGIFSCNTSTINQKVHSVKCNSHCLYKQPFCESLIHESTRASEINSYWSDWREPFGSSFNRHPDDVINSEAICINKNTGLGAIDCLGPGTNCCPTDVDKCKCNTYIEDGVLKLSRQFILKDSLNLRKREINYDRYPIFNSMHPHILSKFDKFHQNNLEKRKDEEYEDEDDNEDDKKGEDIVLEDENDKNDVSSTEDVEKSEIKSKLIEDMKTSTDIFENEDEVPSHKNNSIQKHSGAAKFILNGNNFIFVTFIYLLF